MGSITLKYVGKAVKVSASTVSRVIRGEPNVSPETRKRVFRAIKKMGYSPDGSARAMVKKQTKTIGVSISDVSNPFYPPLIRGIENTINKFGYSMILCNTDENSSKEERYLRVMLEKRIDGLIVAATSSRVPFLETFEARNTPIVCIDRSLENVEADLVCVDNIEGAFTAVQHLIKLGYARIAIITTKKGITTTEERVNGYLNALDRYRIDRDESLIVKGDSRLDGGIKATETLLKLKSPPATIFSCNNLMTMGVFIALKRLRKHIPKDVAVIGFDDLEWAEAFEPPLTVVSQPTYTIGSTAAQLLIQRLLNEGPERKQNVILKTMLVVRKSC